MVLFRPADPDDAGLAEIIADAVGGTPAQLDRVLHRYRTDPRLALLAAIGAGRMVGVAGYEVRDDRIILLHIATHPSHRRRGIGGMLLTVVGSKWPGLAIVAETDSESVKFYIACGFTADSLGEKYPGVERFAVHSPLSENTNDIR